MGALVLFFPVTGVQLRIRLEQERPLNADIHDVSCSRDGGPDLHHQISDEPKVSDHFKFAQNDGLPSFQSDSWRRSFKMGSCSLVLIIN